MAEHNDDSATIYTVTRALNSNAVSALAHGSNVPAILMGRGIGFGRKSGDQIYSDQVQEHYVALGADRIQYLNLLSAIHTDVLTAIGEALELAEGHLGNLHPSVYLMLTDHLAFAVERLRSGAVIENPLVNEINAHFPQEFVAAEMVLRYVNAQLRLELPIDEAAYIALHLRAARTGATVKHPLSQANALAGLTETVLGRLVTRNDATISLAARKELTDHLARLVTRVEQGQLRSNTAAQSIRRDLPAEYEIAEWIITHIAPSTDIPKEGRAGETANLAVFLHGWLQDATS